ncbi:Phosphopantetheine binding protein [Vibrio crassostreae]|uniref:phosphopantetheine-binding protein n=1 Tax=Vibrio crassostreae TaxID=246167 RepID=UPI00104C3945|nr:acyl carrier protein [Vibrio crassostreae]TCN75913.1 phosphopantetheine binding protein [Vibrio crassostreae]CAK2533751.1 Phosphopantetheine binding protein [Vibrio crassostreae]CAK3888747.1 Phosphopantetheine binding protein [Vibrio crassostreae]
MNNNHEMLNILLCEIKFVLEEDDIRGSDNLVEMGGNSLIAMQISATLKQKNRILVNVAQLLGKKISDVELSQLEE